MILLRAAAMAPCRSIRQRIQKYGRRGFWSGIGGNLIIVTSGDVKSPGGKCILFDYGTLKQKRVNRATFGAEANAADDTLEHLKLVQFAFHEVIHGVESAALLTQRALDAQLSIPIELCLDARSVFAAVTAKDITTPKEESLIILIQRMRDELHSFRLNRLWWVDTRSMAADGMNKGTVPRDALLEVSMKGHWTVAHEPCAYPTRYKY
jgi:hypothetical protein